MSNRPDESMPSRTSIAVMAVVTSNVFTVAIWMWAWGQDGIQVALGAFAWCMLGGILLNQTVNRVIRRGQAQVEQILLATDIERERAMNTGTWTSDHPGEVLNVRWDQTGQTYWIQGWVSDNWQVDHELRWEDLETLATVITEVERDGLKPAQNTATMSIRARLDIPGWQYGVGIHPR